ncbi:HdeD family acid-resistance protein [Amycolatopsis balhimycina DSM 5908]|uniref:HdeD family acid-resistance protein n=1 Tax=Amycolatopsis balhimycina DSM 5908 TaxID=1081091 RepID=A0A428VVZ4_AMYBA|nr:HdeD family acid-resistance protein [Amycolatopsis balhimycina]RSM35014.1 HdeD family acid-resistance protein [Amycolatopsis balhimycina DSM 5908]
MTSFAAFSVVEPRKAAPLVAVRGGFAVLFGLFALIWPGATVLVLAILYGVYAIVDGIGGLMQAFRPGDAGHRAAYGILGALGIVAGVLVLVWPGITVLLLALLVGLWAIVTGIAEIAAAIRLRKQIQGEAFLIAAGAISVLAGILIVINPIAGAYGIALLVGIYALLYGIVLLVLAFRLRKLADTTPAA